MMQHLRKNCYQNEQFFEIQEKISAAYQIKFGKKKTKKKRLDNASSPNQRKLISFTQFFLMTDSSLNRALGNSHYDWNWKGASKNSVTWKIEFTSFQPFFDPNDDRCCFMSLLHTIDDLNIQALSINDENIIQEDVVVFDKNK
jgi:hypothetical protein